MTRSVWRGMCTSQAAHLAARGSPTPAQARPMAVIVSRLDLAVLLQHDQRAGVAALDNHGRPAVGGQDQFVRQVNRQVGEAAVAPDELRHIFRFGDEDRVGARSFSILTVADDSTSAFFFFQQLAAGLAKLL